MKRPLLLAALLGLGISAFAETWPMTGGDLRRERRALSPSSLHGALREEWVSSSTCQGYSMQHGPLVLEDRVIGRSSSTLSAWSRTDGGLLWSASGWDYYDPVYDPDRNLIYSANLYNSLSAFDAASGLIKWSWTGASLANHINFSPLLSKEGIILPTGPLKGSPYSSMVCLDPDTRVVNWQKALPTNGCPGTAAYENGELYFCTSDGWVISMDAADGSTRWKVFHGRSQACTPALTDTLVIYQTHAGTFEARLRSNGSLVWQYTALSWGNSGVALCGDLVIITNDDRHVRALDVATGKVVWDTTVEGNFVEMSPLIVCGQVYAVGCADKMYVLDGQSGAIIEKIENFWQNAFTDFAVADSKLYVGDAEGQMHCFSAQQPQNPQLCRCDLKATLEATPTPTSLPTALPPVPPACTDKVLVRYSFEGSNLNPDAGSAFPALQWAKVVCASSASLPAPVYYFDGVSHCASGFFSVKAGEMDLQGQAAWMQVGRTLRLHFQVRTNSGVEVSMFDWASSGKHVQVSAFGSTDSRFGNLKITWTTAQGIRTILVPMNYGSGPVGLGTVGTAARFGRAGIEFSLAANGFLIRAFPETGGPAFSLPDFDAYSGQSGEWLEFGDRHTGGIPWQGYLDDIELRECSIAPTASVTPSATPTVSATPSMTETVTQTMSSTATPIDTNTLTVTLTISPSLTATPSLTITSSLTSSPTPSQTPTFTFTATPDLPCPCQGRAVLANSGDLMLDSKSEVDGDIQAGGSITLQPNSVLSGGMVQHSAAGRTPVPVPSDAVEKGIILVGSGSTLTLPSGRYHASSLTVQLGGTLIAQGQVRLWVDGAIILGGQTRPASGQSNDLWILSGGSQDFHINSQAQVTAVIDVPLARALVDAPLLGCLTAKEATINSNGHVTHDSGLACAGMAAAPTPQAVSAEAGGPSIIKVVAAPNPITGNGTNRVCVQLASDVESLTISLYTAGLTKVAQWQVSGMRGTWCDAPIPNSLQLPNGTYSVRVEASKNGLSTVKWGILVVLK